VQTVELLAKAATWSSWSKATPPPSPPSATARVVRELVPEVEVETIPGVSSFAAAAAAPASRWPRRTKPSPSSPPPTASGHRPPARRVRHPRPAQGQAAGRRGLELLERRDLLATRCFIEKVGSPDERIVRDVASLKGEKVNYLSLMLVQNPKRVRGELRRGCRKRKEAVDVSAAAQA
jgi:precorrin-2/cobalt-factor-2 C20-methyltransferase